MQSKITTLLKCGSEKIFPKKSDCLNFSDWTDIFAA